MSEETNLRGAGRITRAFLAAFLVLAASALVPSLASAALLHASLGHFGAPGSGAGQLNLREPHFLPESLDGGSGLAVNDETGDVYVADTENNRIAEFTPAGSFLRAWGWGVADGSPELQVCTVTCEAGIAGTEPGQLAQPLFVAIDNDVTSPSQGDVYVGGVGRPGRKERQEFHLKGATGGTFNLTFEGQTTNPIAWNASAQQIQERLENLSTIGANNVRVGVQEDTAGSHDVTVEFKEALAEEDLPEVEIDSSQLEPALNIVTETRIDGLAFVPEIVTKFSPAGQLIESWGAKGQVSESTIGGGAPWSSADGLAVGLAGEVLVLGENFLLTLDQTGALVKHVEAQARPSGVAVGGAGHVYVAAHQALEYDPEGVLLGALTIGDDSGGPQLTGIAIGISSGELYLDQEGALLAQIDPTCEPKIGTPGSGCVPSQTFGEGIVDQGAGLAVRSSDDTLYVASAGDDRVDAFDVTLEAFTEAATAVKATTATANGSIDPKSTPVDHCEFQYGTDTSYGTSVPCLDESGDEVGTPAAPITSLIHVHADLSGLAGGTKYHFRLHLSNTAPEYLSAEDASFVTEALATVEEASVAEITATSATLNAKINPHGVAATKYRFEWGPCEPGPSDCLTSPYPNPVPSPDEPIGSGSSPVAVSAPIAPLLAGTTYHFRVVVTDANGTTTSSQHTFAYLTEAPSSGGCPNQALREANNSTTLPDCRAYELVTPTKKNGALIGAPLFGPHYKLAESGESVTAVSIQCFAQSPACVGDRGYEGSPFRFERTASGWTTSPLALPASVYASSTTRMLSGEGALFGTRNPVSGDETFYARLAGAAVHMLGPFAPPNSPQALKGIDFEFAATDDFTHVMYNAEVKRVHWPFDGSSSETLLEYTGFDQSQPLLVGVTEGQSSNDLISACATNIGVSGNFRSMAMSADGSTALFRSQPCAGGTGANAALAVPVYELYARIDGEGPGARTVALSEPEAPQAPQANPACASPACITNTNQASRFRSASAAGTSGDAKRIYFLSPQQLTDEATQDPNPLDTGETCKIPQGANGCNLFLYEDPQEEPLTGTHLYDASAGDSSGLGPQVQQMLAVSADGSHAYFVAEGVLTTEPNSLGQRAFEGGENLYAYEHDAADPQGHIAFITTLSQSDVGSSVGGVGNANVSPDGRYLVFTSHRGLTSDATPGFGTAQVYRYDAQTPRLQRISFGRRGFNDDGNSGLPGADASIVLAQTGLVGQTTPGRSDPTMSHDGRFVFFTSPLALTPGALNEVPTGSGTLARNVYQWEAPGTPDCEEARGCVSLISDGKDVSPSGMIIANVVELLGSDAGGENVFFTTADRLTSADTDTQIDYYDARVDGGFAEPPTPVPCQGDVCKGQGTGPGTDPSPATPGFSGPEEGPKHPIKPKKPHHKHKKKHGKKKAHKKPNKRAGSNRGGKK